MLVEAGDLGAVVHPGQLADVMLRLTRKFGCNLAIARPIATWIELCTRGGNRSALGQMPARVPGWHD
eukprot:14103495-Alexandrium_andersonii.AAC.1